MTLLYFYAKWCEPCKTFGPLVERVAADHPGVSLVKVDVDVQRGIAVAHSVMSMPTLVLLDNRTGRQVNRIVGTAREGRLRAALEAHA